MDRKAMDLKREERIWLGSSGAPRSRWDLSRRRWERKGSTGKDRKGNDWSGLHRQERHDKQRAGEQMIGKASPGVDMVRRQKLAALFYYCYID